MTAIHSFAHPGGQTGAAAQAAALPPGLADLFAAQLESLCSSGPSAGGGFAVPATPAQAEVAEEARADAPPVAYFMSVADAGQLPAAWPLQGAAWHGTATPAPAPAAAEAGGQPGDAGTGPLADLATADATRGVATPTPQPAALPPLAAAGAPPGFALPSVVSAAAPEPMPAAAPAPGRAPIETSVGPPRNAAHPFHAGAPVLPVPGQGDPAAPTPPTPALKPFPAAPDLPAAPAEPAAAPTLPAPVAPAVPPPVPAQPAPAGAPPVHQAALTTQPGQPAFPGEMAAEVRFMVEGGLQRAELRLDPLDLGPIHIQLKVSAATADISFVVAHATTREGIAQALPALREMLAGQGLSLGQSDVAAGQQGPAGGQAAPHRVRAPDGVPVAASPAGRTWVPRRGAGMLDLYA